MPGNAEGRAIRWGHQAVSRAETRRRPAVTLRALTSTQRLCLPELSSAVGAELPAESAISNSDLNHTVLESIEYNTAVFWRTL